VPSAVAVIAELKRHSLDEVIDTMPVVLARVRVTVLRISDCSGSGDAEDDEQQCD